MKRVGSPSRHVVRAAIAISMRHGGAKLQYTAGLLGVSVRSLQRRLGEMGTSYSELVAEVRLDTSCHLLMETHERIADIAAQLGYSSPSSFNRTFIRLLNVQPGAYRQQHPAWKTHAKQRRQNQKSGKRRSLTTSE